MMNLPNTLSFSNKQQAILGQTCCVVSVAKQDT